MQFVESNHFSTTTTLWRASQSPLPSQVLDSNQRIRFCRPSPNHSANLTLCSSIGIRTPTFSSVVKGAIRYTIEPTLLPLSFSIMFPTLTLSYSYNLSTPMSFCSKRCWMAIIIPTTISFVTNHTIVVDCIHLFYSFFFHFTLGLFT